MAYSCKTISSPVGDLTLVASDKGLTAILWENDDPLRVRLGELTEAPEHPVLVETARQLADYFEGSRRSFDLPLDFVGTSFQKRVWEALLRIPFGETRSYGQIARELGRPGAMRAVGGADGKNPISIVAPCHRVIGASGVYRVCRRDRRQGPTAAHEGSDTGLKPAGSTHPRVADDDHSGDGGLDGCQYLGQQEPLFRAASATFATRSEAIVAVPARSRWMRP